MAKGYYNDHYTLKKIRLEKLKETRGKCEICKKPAKTIHHIDKNQNNHAKANLCVVCNKCHRLVHASPYKARLTERYGISLCELALKTNIAQNTLYGWHKKGELEAFIKTGLRPRGRSVYQKKYGLTQLQIAQAANISLDAVVLMDWKGILHNYLKDNNIFNRATDFGPA